MHNRWNKSPIRNNLEDKQSIAGKVSAAAAHGLAQPWTSVPPEQQMEESLKEQSSAPIEGPAFVERFF